MADPAPDLPAGGCHGPACQVLAADVQARLELLQGDLLPVHGEGEQEGLDVRQAQTGLHDKVVLLSLLSLHPSLRLAETIHQFAAHPILRCQHCKAQLRLWPEGPDFLCDGQQCADSGEKIRNNGKNR